MDKIKGTLEIDRERGVIYFTANPPRAQQLSKLKRRPPWLRLRICRLPSPIPDKLDNIDIVAAADMTSYQVAD